MQSCLKTCTVSFVQIYLVQKIVLWHILQLKKIHQGKIAWLGLANSRILSLHLNTLGQVGYS